MKDVESTKIIYASQMNLIALYSQIVSTLETQQKAFSELSNNMPIELSSPDMLNELIQDTKKHLKLHKELLPTTKLMYIASKGFDKPEE